MRYFSLVASLLLLVQCAVSNVEDFGFQEDIQKHFGPMNYGKVIFEKGIPSRRKVDIRFLNGSGRIEDKKGEALNYRWVFLTGKNGDLLTGYVGTSRMTSISAVQLTRGETKDALRRCSGKEAAQDVFDCIDRVIDAVIHDCQYSLSVSECHKHCWYNLDMCRGG